MAGELGTSVGSIYTSLTGFYLESGTGSVQLLVLGHLLQKCNFLLWDLGMFIEYKSSLGAGLLKRDDFLAKYRQLRQVKTANLECKEKTNCRDIVNEIVNKTNQEQKNNDNDGDEKMESNDNNKNGDGKKEMSKNERKRLAKLERRKLAKLKAKQEREKKAQETVKSKQPNDGDTDDAKDIAMKNVVMDNNIEVNLNQNDENNDLNVEK